MRTIAVVGASLAGLRSAEALRAQGFDGRLVVVGDEPHEPYDRPPLSKDFLLGTADRESLALSDPDALAALDAEWRLGVRADRLAPDTREVHLSDGSSVVADGVVIATGGAARTLPGTLSLRTLDDAVALRAALTGGAERLVVVGAGFIGAEVASTARKLGLDVTVVEVLPIPLGRVLGPEIGAVCGELHLDHGVALRCGVGVDQVSSSGVVLTDGTVLAADVVVAGIGAYPATDWLADSGVAVGNGVLCDQGGVTSVPGVVAVGDVARWSGQRHEHWTSAAEQSSVAVRNLLAGQTVAVHDRPGYFWSDQYGVRVQFVGETHLYDEVRYVDGTPEDRKFAAVYLRGDTVVGVVAMNNAKHFTRLRRQLGAATLSTPAP
ncbi:NAD(P)/FAD-dependent oxidoreductase [Umezawaea sp. NPDC059074]|uniref:NAD(P)/FAD-dependent oxidoreductase n=1 Tax=Umezawaea sp. NPDC059074 TaxID=3346716 RepID=UPI0036930D32